MPEGSTLVSVPPVSAVASDGAVPDRAAMASAQLLEQLIRLVYPERGPHDMHPGQWAALRYLSRANPEASTVAGLARFLGVTLGPASRAASALTRKGLVTGTRDPKDRRSIRLTLTEAGTALIRQDPLQRLGNLVATLPQGQRDAMIDGVRQLFAGLSGKPSLVASTLPALSFVVEDVPHD
jgi:DNA-binding MarR family transcriptional regulator